MLNNDFLNWYRNQVQLQPTSPQEPAPGNLELSQQQNTGEGSQYAPKSEVTESVELEVPVLETQKTQIDDAGAASGTTPVNHRDLHCNSEQSQESLQSHRTFTCVKCGQVGHDPNPSVKNTDGIESSTVSLCEQCNKKPQINDQIPQQQQQESVTSQDVATAVELLQQLQWQQQLFQAQQNLRSMEYLQGQNMVMQMQRMQQPAMFIESLYDAGSSIRRAAG